MLRKIENQEDIEELLKNFGYFHDSLIKQVSISNNEYIDEDGKMYGNVSGHNYSITIIFQRISISGPDAVRVIFKDTEFFHLMSALENNTSQIDSIFFQIIDGKVYFATDSDWSPMDKDNNSTTWLISNSCYWIKAPNCLGDHVDLEPKDIAHDLESL